MATRRAEKMLMRKAEKRKALRRVAIRTKGADAR